MKRQLNEKEGSTNHTGSSMNEGQGSLNAKKSKDLKPSLYQEANIVLLEAGNFLCNARKEGVVISTTSIYKVNHLIEDQRNPCLLLQDKAELNQKIQKKLPCQY